MRSLGVVGRGTMSRIWLYDAACQRFRTWRGRILAIPISRRHGLSGAIWSQRRNAGSRLFGRSDGGKIGAFVPRRGVANGDELPCARAVRTVISLRASCDSVGHRPGEGNRWR
jgi:hypothetical protein